MNKIIFTIALIIFFISSVNAKAEKSSICEPREPKIDYVQAISIAKKALVVYLPVEGSYIDLVSLSCNKKKYMWTIGFRRKAYESGHLLIYVYMDSSTKVSVVKDG